jgi:hypothetical protein
MSTAQIPVKYIGRRPHWEGTLYNVKLRFDAGQTRPLPEPLALKFLTHTDTFERDSAYNAPPKSVEQETEELLAEAEQRAQVETKRDMELTEVLERIDMLEKPQLAEIATRYGQKLDGRRSVDTLRAEVRQIINQQGLV